MVASFWIPSLSGLVSHSGSLSRLSISVLAAVFSFGSALNADSRYPALDKGYSIGAVVKSWGEPKEKIERQLKHQVIWYYPEGSYVLFEKGRVLRWRSPTAGSEADSKPTPQPTAQSVVTSAIDSETQDLVRDIAKELPSSPDSPAVESSMSAQPLGSAPINQPTGAATLPPPPGIVPGETNRFEMLDEDESG